MTIFYSKQALLSYIGLVRGRTVSEKLPKIPVFWTLFNVSVTVSLISAESPEWSPFNLIFNLQTRKQSGGGNTSDHGGDKGL
jgi:hypothetical protein